MSESIFKYDLLTEHVITSEVLGELFATKLGIGGILMIQAFKTPSNSNDLSF